MRHGWEENLGETELDVAKLEPKIKKIHILLAFLKPFSKGNNLVVLYKL